MIVFYGQRLYGSVDAIPGLCDVQTEFFHIYWMPIVPLGSYAVVGESEDGFQGTRVPLCWKSVFKAYLSLICGLPAVVSGVMFLTSMGSPHGLNLAALVTFLVAAGGLVGANALGGNADYNRALELADHMKLNDYGRTVLDLQYGQISQAVAEERFAAFEAEQQRQLEAKEAQREARRAERVERKEAQKQLNKERRAKFGKLGSKKKSCPECNRRVREASRSCKHCGHEF